MFLVVVEMGRGKAIPLTDTKIDSAPVGRLWGSRQPGLLIVTSPKCRQSFKVRYDLNGKQRFKVIGDYPMLTLDEARKIAHEIRAKAKTGAKPAIKGEIMVAKVVNEFLRNPRYPLSKRSTTYQMQWFKRYERVFESHIELMDPAVRQKSACSHNHLQKAVVA